jgi:hypothetical protein
VEHDEGQFLQTVYPIAREYGGPGRFGFHREARLTEMSHLATAQSALQLWQEWSVYWDLNRSVLLEKSPPNLIRYRFLQAMFPGAYFITIVRHPVAVAFATQKWSKTGIGHLIEHWLNCHELWLEDSQLLKRQFAFKYEDFVTSPQSILDALFAFLNLSSIPSKRQVINSNPRYFEKWKAQQGDWRSRHLTRTLIKRLDRRVSHFGYSLKDCDRLAPLPVYETPHSDGLVDSPSAL